MQSGKHLRSCLVQLRAHTRASPEVRPSCSGLQLVTFCKLPRMKPAQPLWAECHCQTALRQSEEIVPPYIQSELLPFHFMFIVTDLPALCCCEESGSISLKTFPQMLWAAPRTPQNHLFSRLNKSSSPSLSSPEEVQIQIQLHLDHRPWNWFNLLKFFLNEEAKKKDVVL